MILCKKNVWVFLQINSRSGFHDEKTNEFFRNKLQAFFNGKNVFQSCEN